MTKRNLLKIFLLCAVVLQIVKAQGQPTIITQPISANAGVGATLQFTNIASGSGTLTYQWLKNGTNLLNGTFAPTRANVSGANTTILKLTGITANDESTNYSCRVTNISGSITSSVVALALWPSITTQPVGANLSVGASVTFSVVAVGTAPLTYQWQTNFGSGWGSVSGKTQISYGIGNLQTNNSGNYRVVIDNSFATTYSSNAVLNVGIAPSIIAAPTNLTVVLGQSATFSITAAGTPLSYYWKKGGVFISGATNNSLTFNSVATTNAGTYTCQVSNFLSSVTPGPGAVLTVLYPPVINNQPASQTIGVGSNFTVSVTAGGVPALAYQWFTNTMTIIGATNSSYTVTNAQTYHGGNYLVVITNSQGSITSSIATISVNYFSPIITLQPVGTNVPFGSPFTLKAMATGTAPLSWQWRTNLMPIPGATTNTYIVAAAQFSDAASYDVVVTNSSGNGVNITNSSAAIVNVGYAPVVVSPPISVTNNIGDTVSFTCLVTGTPPISLQWMLNGYTLTNQTGSTLTLSNVQSTNIGFYALTATNIFGTAGSSNATLNVNGFSFSQWAGLEAYYALNGDATDSSGYGNNGTNFGAAAAIDRFGNTNSAMYFDGITNYIQCKTGGYFGSNFTISAWVNAAAYQRYSRILDFGSGPATDNTDLPLTSGTSGMPYFEAYIGSVQIAACSSPSVIPQNSWVHVVGTCSATQMSLYFNGVQMLIKTGFNLTRTNIITTRNYLGKSNWNTAQPPDLLFMGLLDDIRILNRALSSNEVAQLYAVEADLPVITQQPQAQTVNVGSTVTFSVIATASHPLTYQWRTNDVPIVGATNSSLTLSNVQAGNMGFYSVTVSNTVAGVASSGALLNLTGAADPTTNGLIAYYPLNGNANDAGTNRLNGITNSSGTFWTTNRFGVANSALGLNGSTGFMSVSDPNALLNFDVRSNNYSITTWVLLKNLGAPQEIVMDRGTTLNPASSYTLGFDNNLDRFFIQMWDAGGTQPNNYVTVGSTTTATIGHWYQMAAVVLNQNVTLFVDGVAESMGTVPAGFATTKNAEGIRDFGRFAWLGYGNYLSGNIDDIRFYNRALSSDEVAYLYALESHSTVVPSPTLTASFSTGSAFNLNVSGGLPGGNYVLQTATNLAPPIQWQSLLTNTADTNGVSQFTDTNLNTAQKFYRVSTP